MGFLDTLLGRSKPVPPNLDQLFALPAAAVTLQVASDLQPTGIGAVCFKAAEGAPFAGMRAQVEQLLALDGGRYTEQTDDYGFTWLVRRTKPPDLESLVTDLHAVNSGLLEAGFGSALLCTVICFTGGPRPLALVYLYKRGTWYPFAPLEDKRRDNARELQVSAVLGSDLRMEPDPSRWFPLYGAPGL
ncbi:MAG: hypothetical protein ABI662_05455 [Dermatophilaceae bacterium]